MVAIGVRGTVSYPGNEYIIYAFTHTNADGRQLIPLGSVTTTVDLGISKLPTTSLW